MLQQIRDRAQGIVIWTIVGLIIITFALFGLSSYLTDSPTVSVATVNGTEVTPNDLQRAYQNYLQRLQEALGDKYRPDLFQENDVRKQVLESLIQQELLNQELERSAYYAAPEQIVKQIANMEIFQDDGEFSPERYKQILGSQRINSFMFEQQIGRDLTEKQLTSGMLLSGFVTNDELERFARLQNQKRELAYLQLSKSHYLKTITLSTEEVETYYESHKAEFSTPEKISVEYVALNLDEMSREIDVSDEAIANYYAQQRESLTRQPEQRKASHILFKVESADEESAAMDKLNRVQQKLAAGENFDTLAKEFSDDIGSARQGGDLGYFGRGVMDKAFEDTAFSLNKGEISEPVRSRFGYHLIKLDDIREAQIAKLEELKEGLRHDLQVQQAEQSFYEKVDKLNNLSYEVPDSLTPVAESLGLEIKTSPLFTRQGGNELFANSKVISVAFSEEVMTEGRNSQLVELSDTHVLVLRMAQHIPTRLLALDDVRDQVKARIKSEKVAMSIVADSESALDRLRSGTDPEELARSMNAKWKAATVVSRGGGEAKVELNPQIRQELYRMPRPVEGEKAYSTVLLANGDGAVLILSAVTDGENFADENRLNEQRKLISIYAKAIQSGWMAELRNNADISRRLDSKE